MPWMETDAMRERVRFLVDYTSGDWTMSELCRRHGVSRPTGYKWVKRFEADGVGGLRERSRAPANCPHATPDAVVELILAARREHGWGARKLRRVLERRHPGLELPARSTIFDILKRNGLVRPKRRRTRWKHPGAVPLTTTAPNQVWTADFKGQFRTRNGVYCYPLTVVDHSQPLPARVPGSALGANGRGKASLRAPVPRVRSARRHPHRQRRSLRVDRYPRSVRAQHLVVATRHHPAAHPPREPAGERRTRAHAQDVEEGHDSSSCRQPPLAAAEVRPVPQRVQPRATPRSARRRHAGVALHAIQRVHTRVASRLRNTRVTSRSAASATLASSA